MNLKGIVPSGIYSNRERIVEVRNIIKTIKYRWVTQAVFPKEIYFRIECLYAEHLDTLAPPLNKNGDKQYLQRLLQQGAKL